MCNDDHLKLSLKDNKTSAVKHTRKCLDTLLEEPDFLAWLARKANVKLNRLKNRLKNLLVTN